MALLTTPAGCDKKRKAKPRAIEWVRIPGGSFTMGSKTGAASERPVHRVSVKTFEMSRTEVTVGQYARCVKAGKCTAPQRGPSCSWGAAGRVNHPVNCLAYAQALAFARFAGARLPTEAEWEFAARGGGKDQRFPWGKKRAHCGLAVMKSGGATGCGKSRPHAVCSKPDGNTRHGLCDMAGNVAEWVADKYHDSYRGAPTDGSARKGGGPGYVSRGGSYMEAAAGITTTYRGGDHAQSRISYLGFRLARTPKAGK